MAGKPLGDLSNVRDWLGFAHQCSGLYAHNQVGLSSSDDRLLLQSLTIILFPPSLLISGQDRWSLSFAFFIHPSTDTHLLIITFPSTLSHFSHPPLSSRQKNVRDFLRLKWPKSYTVLAPDLPSNQSVYGLVQYQTERILLYNPRDLHRGNRRETAPCRRGGNSPTKDPTMHTNNLPPIRPVTR